MFQHITQGAEGVTGLVLPKGASKPIQVRTSELWKPAWNLLPPTQHANLHEAVGDMFRISEHDVSVSSSEALGKDGFGRYVDSVRPERACR